MTLTDQALTIRPDDINLKQHFWNAFDHNETEISASWVVRLCQRRGGWSPFTGAEIEALYNSFGHRNFSFNRLVDSGRAYSIHTGWSDKGGGWIKRDGDTYTVTPEFIMQCYQASPVTDDATESEDRSL